MNIIKKEATLLVEKFQKAHSHKMDDHSRIEHPTAKACALIAVDMLIGVVGVDPFDTLYWKDVRNEIEKL